MYKNAKPLFKRLNMYTEKFASYYDTLHSSKNYKEECDLILKNSINFSKLLDIGCGTFTHGIILSKKYEKVLGVDLSEPMLKIAEKKIKNLDLKNLETYCGPLENISPSNFFDTIISMFYVVNHISSLTELKTFFTKVIGLLNHDGVFIFDCWNGTACRIEKPNPASTKTIKHDFHTVISETKTDTDLLESYSVMNTSVKIFFESELVDQFDYTLEQKLWTPDIFIDILKSVGFKTIQMIPFYNQHESPKETDYKLTFICKKN